MGLFSEAIRINRSGKSNLLNPQQWLVDFFGGGGMSESGAVVNQDTMMSESAVWCAVMFLASNLASLPCPVLETVGRQRQKKKDHYLHQRLNVMANPEMTAMTYRESCMYYQSLWGTSFSIIERDKLRQVTALWPVHPDNVMRIERKESRLRYTILSVDKRELVFDQDDILRIPGVGNGLMGLSMIEHSRDSIGLILAMRSFANLFFRNGSNMGVIFEHPKALGATAHQNLTKSLQSTYAGLGKSHKAMVVEEGMQVKTVGVDPERSQLLEARQFSINDVARWFNLPPHVLKDLTNANYSNMQQQSLELITYSFRPWFVKLEQSYEAFLLRDFERGKLSVRHNANALMRGDEKSRGEYYRMMFGTGSMTPNEIRELEDVNPIEEEWADKTYLQLNLVPTDLLADVIKNQMEQAGRQALQVPAKRDRELRTPSLKDSADDLSDEEDPGLDDRVKDSEPLTEDEKQIQGLKAIQNSYRGKIEAVAGKIVKKECDQVEKMVNSAFGKRGNAEFLRRLESFYASLPESIKEDFAPVLKQYSELISKEAGRMVLGDGFMPEAVMTEELEKFMESYLDVYAVRHCGSSLGQIKSIVETTAPDQIEAVLIQRISEWRARRPLSIADDEEIRVSNAVARETWRQQGVTKLKWVTQGSKTCPFCKQLNGKTVGIISPFLEKDDILTAKDKSGNYMKIKGRKAHPPIHKGCVCAIVPVN